jgi:hypothetical protein
MTATIFDDLANRRALPELVDLVGRGPVPIATLRRLTGRPVVGDEGLAELWLRALVDLAERAGLGHMEPRATRAWSPSTWATPICRPCTATRMSPATSCTRRPRRSPRRRA